VPELEKSQADVDKIINMSLVRLATLAVSAMLLAACGRDSDDRTESVPISPAAFVDQPVLSAAEYLQSPAYAIADSTHGERLALQCRACHTLERNGAILLGPNLFGVFGRPAASVDGFDYSPALESAGFVWTPAALDAWLASPSRFLPGSRMAFAGLQNASDRDALIAYLLQVTDDTTKLESGGQ
jgi:cytochrome c